MSLGGYDVVVAPSRKGRLAARGVLSKYEKRAFPQREKSDFRQEVDGLSLPRVPVVASAFAGRPFGSSVSGRSPTGTRVRSGLSGSFEGVVGWVGWCVWVSGLVGRGGIKWGLSDQTQPWLSFR